MPLTMKGKQKKLLETKAELLKSLAHPIRLCIVKNLIDSGGCNVTKMQGCLTMPQSTISQHLSKLKAYGIVEGKRSGTEITYYAINQDAINVVKTLLPDVSE
ncbi:MAG: metalloregulator ArsR/SmtB family transcription factor [Peptococcaceae bacterium]|nr:metalloregulator ArsR/SmtB family transcription factor [Peptococcaceae bacterium]MDH7525402.1 metalloregulator ArsR/SmtB family transcription factor [Peptococcaceae bacterium]